MLRAMYRIFDKLGGDEATLQALRQESCKAGWPSRPTLAAWKKNGELPARAMRLLMKIADRRGVAYCAEDFIAGASPTS